MSFAGAGIIITTNHRCLTQLLPKAINYTTCEMTTNSYNFEMFKIDDMSWTKAPKFHPFGHGLVGGWCLAVVNQPDNFCGEQDMIQTFVSEGAQLLWLGNAVNP